MEKGDTFAGVLTAPIDSQAAAAGMVRQGDSKDVLPNFPSTLFAANPSPSPGRAKKRYD